MSHLKTQIRLAAVALLTSKVTEVNGEVYPSRVKAADKLPMLAVFTDRELAQKATVGFPPRLDRTLDLVVVAKVKSNLSAVDDALDELQLSVEKALSEDIPANTLGGLVQSITIESANQFFSVDAEQPVAQVEMHFRVEFKTEANSPDNPA